MINEAASLAAILCRRWEGLRRGPYLCPAGVPTIGYWATYYENGTRVAMTDSIISQGRAEALLMWHIKRVYLPAVLKLCPNIDEPFIPREHRCPVVLVPQQQVLLSDRGFKFAPDAINVCFVPHRSRIDPNVHVSWMPHAHQLLVDPAILSGG